MSASVAQSPIVQSLSLCRLLRWFRRPADVVESTWGETRGAGGHGPRDTLSVSNFDQVVDWAQATFAMGDPQRSHGQSPREQQPTSAALARRWIGVREQWAPLAYLRRQFNLSDLEAFALALALAAEQCGSLRNEASPQGLSPGLVLQLYVMTIDGDIDLELRRQIGPSSALFRLRLLDVTQPGSTPWINAVLSVDPRIYQFVLDTAALPPHAIEMDSMLRFMVEPLSDSGSRLPADEYERIAEHVGALGAMPLCQQLIGNDRGLKLHVVREFLQRLSHPSGPWRAYLLRAESLLDRPIDFERFIAMWAREQRLLSNVVLIIDAQCIAANDRQWPHAIARLLGQTMHSPVIVLTPRPLRLAEVQVHVIDPASWAPTGGWTTELDDLDSDLGIQRIAPSGVRLEHVVLPRTEKDLLESLRDQCRNMEAVYDEWGLEEHLSRGRGISALFSGDSGTGKTMAAEALANELAIPLFRIDLSEVINKYVGETEKNLRRIFDVAENRRVILFFDEADALFGARSAVKDSHDRFANIQINYLLQRFESFNGISILATNMKECVDKAFYRRLGTAISFVFPTPELRKAIWQQVLPPFGSDLYGRPSRLPVILGDADYQLLSQLPIPGGTIRAIATKAVFCARRRQGAHIELFDVYTAARYEYYKLEQVFKWPGPVPSEPAPPDGFEEQE